MLKDFKKILRSNFFRNILTMFSGASIAQIITLLSIPILTRLFSPEEFGFIALYLSIANIFGTISSGKYDLAIMIPKNDNDAIKIFSGSILIVIIFSFVSLVSIIILKNISTPISSFIVPNYFYFLPLSILLIGSIKSFTQWLNRKKDFPYLAKTHIVQNGTASTVKLSAGYFTSLGTWGLFWGHIAGQGIMFLSLLRQILKKYKLLIKNNFSKEIKTALKEHSNFPIFAMPMGFLNIISKDIMLYILNIFFSTTTVGLYTNAQKVTNYPLFFITQAFTSVFYQKLSETKNKIQLYIWSYIINFFIASIAMIPIVLWGEELFSFVLGKDWEIAGSIAKYLVPLTITSFATRNVINVFSLTKKNHLLLIWQCIYFILITAIIFLSHNYSFNKMIFNFSLGGAILYIILAFIGLKILLNKK